MMLFRVYQSFFAGKSILQKGTRHMLPMLYFNNLISVSFIL